VADKWRRFFWLLELPYPGCTIFRTSGKMGSIGAERNASNCLAVAGKHEQLLSGGGVI
jgi:hypothetical protein